MSSDPRLLASVTDAVLAAGRVAYAAERHGSAADLANARKLLADVERRAHELLDGVPPDSLDGTLLALRVASAVESVVSRHGDPSMRRRARLRVGAIERRLVEVLAARAAERAAPMTAMRRVMVGIAAESRGAL